MLVGCNALVGVPENMDEQPWRTVYLIAFFVVCLVPVITLITLFAVRLTKPTFIRQRKPLFFFCRHVYADAVCLVGNGILFAQEHQYKAGSVYSDTGLCGANGVDCPVWLLLWA